MKAAQEEKITPLKKFTSVELFAGAGGLAIGLEQAGFEVMALNEIDKDACNTLRTNRPQWNVLEGDIRNVDFKPFAGIDFLSGGFPCRALPSQALPSQAMLSQLTFPLLKNSVNGC